LSGQLLEGYLGKISRTLGAWLCLRPSASSGFLHSHSPLESDVLVGRLRGVPLPAPRAVKLDMSNFAKNKLCAACCRLKLRHLLAGTPASCRRLCAKSKPARGMRRGRPSGSTGGAKGLHGPRRVSMSAVQHCPRTRPPGAQRRTRSRAHPRLAPTMLQRVQRKARLYANCVRNMRSAPR